MTTIEDEPGQAMSDFPITFFHNPACGTSRNALAMVQAAGYEPSVIDYLQTGWTKPQLQALLAAMGARPRDVMRDKGTPAAELGLRDERVDDDRILTEMIAHPILVNRPIVQTPRGTKLCRPSEVVLSLLERQPASFTKEDGAVATLAPSAAGAELPALRPEFLPTPTLQALEPIHAATHPPRFLLLYGSLRQRSYSRLAVEEAARLLERFGGECRIYDPEGLPQPDSVAPDHPKVAELRALFQWSEGQVWCSPERHGTITGIMKSQIDWVPLAVGGIRPSQGRTLAVMQVSGGSQSFNAVNALRLLGRWMRMVTIPNQSSVAKAYEQFDEAGRMKPSSYYDRIVDVMEELFKFTLLLRDRSDYLVSRYSERQEEGLKAGKALAAAAMTHERGKGTG
jgi:arsenic resistance protein ArsH